MDSYLYERHCSPHCSLYAPNKQSEMVTVAADLSEARQELKRTAKLYADREISRRAEEGRL
eukprot:12119-Heterococcus_DN1.PRE.2